MSFGDCYSVSASVSKFTFLGIVHILPHYTGARGEGSSKCLYLIMGEEGEGGDRIHKQIKSQEKSYFVCSISLIVLYNNKVNRTPGNALGHKLFTFFV